MIEGTIRELNAKPFEAKPFEVKTGDLYMIENRTLDMSDPVDGEGKLSYAANIMLHKTRDSNKQQYTFNHPLWANLFETYAEAYEIQHLYKIPGKLVQVKSIMVPTYRIFKTYCNLSVKKIWWGDFGSETNQFVDASEEFKVNLLHYFFNIETQLTEFHLKLKELKIDTLNDAYGCINKIMTLEYE